MGLLSNIGGSIPDDYIVIDLETTGYSCENDEIIEIGAVKFNKHEECARFSTFVKPSVPVSRVITSLTRISNDMLIDAPILDDVSEEFLEFIKGYTLVAHNASFDLSFLQCKLGIVLRNKVIDTLQLARCCIKDAPNHKLETLKEYLNLDCPSHRAVEDCLVTAKLLQHCLSLAQSDEGCTDPEDTACDCSEPVVETCIPRSDRCYFNEVWNYNFALNNNKQAEKDVIAMLSVGDELSFYLHSRRVDTSIIIASPKKKVTNYKDDYLRNEIILQLLEGIIPTAIIKEIYSYTDFVTYCLEVNLDIPYSREEPTVFLAENSSKYHAEDSCQQTDMKPVPLSFALRVGRIPCKYCYKHQEIPTLPYTLTFPTLVKNEVNASCGKEKQKRNTVKQDYFVAKINENADYDESTVSYDDGESIIFSQKSFVITGDIKGFTRAELQQIIADRGGKSVSAVSKKTDYLIVGMQNKNVIKDSDNIKSSKIIKAEQIRADGYPILILSDEFFIAELGAEEVSASCGKEKQKRNTVKQDYFVAKVNENADYDESTVSYDDGEPIIFSQKAFVITGDIKGFTRSELQQIIADRGGKSVSAVSKKTDYLIVGMQNKNAIKDSENIKSNKIIKAEQIRADGHPIHILSDEFFIAELGAEVHA